MQVVTNHLRFNTLFKMAATDKIFLTPFVAQLTIFNQLDFLNKAIAVGPIKMWYVQTS